jgi:O-acetyl-ADP-ribose deacetylase (regulator of RNase III)
MGAGIAVQFKRRHPAMYRAYRDRCRSGTFQLGDVFTWETEDGLVIYNLATQPAPGPSATLDAIGRSVTSALADASTRGIAQIGVPRIGAGLGGLVWGDVEAVLRDAAQSSTVNLIAVSLPQ